MGSFTVGADSGFDNALSPVVQTGACVSNLRARMKYYQNTEETFFDSTQVIANNGLGDVVIASSAGAFGGQAMVVEFGDPLFITSPQWQSLDIALEPLFGNVIPQNMTFRFSADTLDTLFNYGYGSFIDDFEVVCDVSTEPGHRQQLRDAADDGADAVDVGDPEDPGHRHAGGGRDRDLHDHGLEPGRVELERHGHPRHAAAELRVHLGPDDAGELQLLDVDGDRDLQHRGLGCASEPMRHHTAAEQRDGGDPGAGGDEPVGGDAGVSRGFGDEPGDHRVGQLPGRHGDLEASVDTGALPAGQPEPAAGGPRCTCRS